MLIITVVLCIVFLCMRRSYRKEESPVNDNTSKLNTYDFTKAIALEHVYDTIKLEDTDAINPPYDALTKPYSKTSENEYSYMQPNELTQHSGYSKVDPTTDQSCGKRGIHSRSTANTPEQDEYGVVNQPQT